MAIHLDNENDSLKLIQILTTHTLYEGQEKRCNVNATDFAKNSALHHAALKGKQLVC
jgi:CRISPR/Cas system-associated endonuclease/helicase Cas3